MTTTPNSSESIRIAFMCVQNAGGSQMATAFADRERARRGLDDRVVLLTGGTHPADHVHEEVVDVMDEVGFDLSDRRPCEITVDQLQSCDYVATMGCSTQDIRAVGSKVAELRSAANQNSVNSGDVDVRDWALDDPDGQNLEYVREIRETIEERVTALFDEIAGLSWNGLYEGFSIKRPLLSSGLSMPATKTMTPSICTYHGTSASRSPSRTFDFPALFRFDPVHQRNGVSETGLLDHIKKHYYQSHTDSNPTEFVPVGPNIDVTIPHGRKRTASE